MHCNTNSSYSNVYKADCQSATLLVHPWSRVGALESLPSGRTKLEKLRPGQTDPLWTCSFSLVVNRETNGYTLTIVKVNLHLWWLTTCESGKGKEKIFATEKLPNWAQTVEKLLWKDGWKAQSKSFWQVAYSASYSCWSPGGFNRFPNWKKIRYSATASPTPVSWVVA